MVITKTLHSPKRPMAHGAISQALSEVAAVLVDSKNV